MVTGYKNMQNMEVGVGGVECLFLGVIFAYFRGFVSREVIFYISPPWDLGKIRKNYKIFFKIVKFLLRNLGILDLLPDVISAQKACCQVGQNYRKCKKLSKCC